MIKKLRKKFVVTALLSIFGLLTTILVTINVINFALVENDANQVMKMIIDGGGQFGDNQMPPNEQNNNQTTTNTTVSAKQSVSSDETSTDNSGQEGGFSPVGPGSPEVAMTMRYFTIKFVNGEGSVEKMNVNIVNESEAIEWAKTLLSYKKGWTRTYYRYQVWERDGNTYVTVLDQSRELSPSFRVLNVSVMGEILGLIITLVALIIVSKFFVLPLEKSNRKQKRFINDASDALKNPITVLETQVKILEHDDQIEMAEIMQRSVDSLKQLVVGLDSLLLYESGKANPNMTEFNLSELVNEVSTLYKNEFDKAGKKLVTNIAANVMITADKVKITELLNIVLENAYKYSETNASIDLSLADDRKTIFISNDGKNIQEGDLDSVFERFYRSEDVKESGIDGMGLSLSIAREIVKLHDGRIQAYGHNQMFNLKIEL